MTSELQKAFAETHYIVHHQSPFTLRIGQANPALDELLQAGGHKGAAFITAWNAYSQSLSKEENASRQGELLADILVRSLDSLLGIGQHPGNGWPGEDSILVLGIDLEAAKALASKYEQWAFVWAPASGVPELVVLPKRPPLTPAQNEVARKLCEISNGIKNLKKK